MSPGKARLQVFLLCLLVLFNYPFTRSQQPTLKVAGDDQKGVYAAIHNCNQLPAIQFQEKFLYKYSIQGDQVL